MAASAPSTTDEDELERLQGAKEVQDPKELAADMWESDEELDAFTESRLPGLSRGVQLTPHSPS